MTQHNAPDPKSSQHTKRLTSGFLKEISADHFEQPRVSLFQPTHRHHPENQQDPIRFRGLVKNLELQLLEDHQAAEVASLLAPFVALAHDADFWNHTLDGLAVFAAPGWFEVVVLPRGVQELIIVADSFHTKPLRRMLQTADRYQVLGLNLHEVKLYEGNRDGIAEVGLDDAVPHIIAEELGREAADVSSENGDPNTTSTMEYAHGSSNDEVENHADRFFRAVDRGVIETISRPSGLPLILAALPEHHHLFQEVSNNPALVAEGIKMHPDAMKVDELRDCAWAIFDPLYRARLAALGDDFAVAKSRNLGFDDLGLISEAVAAGRVGTLLIEADREIVGHIHDGSGNIHLGTTDHPQGEDLLDDLGERVLKMGGQVFVIPTEQMPTTTGAAATCRY